MSTYLKCLFFLSKSTILQLIKIDRWNFYHYVDGKRLVPKYEKVSHFIDFQLEITRYSAIRKNMRNNININL